MPCYRDSREALKMCGIFGAYMGEQATTASGKLCRAWPQEWHSMKGFGTHQYCRAVRWEPGMSEPEPSAPWCLMEGADDFQWEFCFPSCSELCPNLRKMKGDSMVVEFEQEVAVGADTVPMGMRANVTCKPDHILNCDIGLGGQKVQSGMGDVICNANGEWSQNFDCYKDVAECAELEIPFGKVKTYWVPLVEGNEVDVSCNEGFQLAQDGKRMEELKAKATCSPDGAWTPSFSCLPIPE